MTYLLGAQAAYGHNNRKEKGVFAYSFFNILQLFLLIRTAVESEVDLSEITYILHLQYSLFILIEWVLSITTYNSSTPWK